MRIIGLTESEHLTVCSERLIHVIDVVMQTVVTARPIGLLVVFQSDKSMPQQTARRIEALEHAVMHFEGAHYALHDLVAVLLAKCQDKDAGAVIQTLADQVSVHAEKIGEIRLAGYTQELESMRTEVAHARGDTRSLFARLADNLAVSKDDLA